MDITNFNYYLPEELIAQRPLKQRDKSKLLVLDRETKQISHHTFSDIPRLCNPGDLVILNNSKVFSARIFAKRHTGRNIEVLLLGPGLNDYWCALIKPSKAVRPGEELVLPDNSTFIAGDREPDGISRKIEFPRGTDPFEIADKFGETPLPPYIKRKTEAEDLCRYQTIYAKEKGSAAAPTAGLHFTHRMFEEFEKKGIKTAFVTLHVGPGTFLPVRTQNIEEHKMQQELCLVDPEIFSSIEETRKKGGKVIAVGTTTTRSIETAFRFGNPEKGYQGWSDLFVYPPFKFKGIDSLVTNFHLPESTLLMLVSAFAGRRLVLRAYKEAVEKKYRFYSYGDAMFIL